MGNQKNLKNCGFVKTILMLLVIFGHACAFWSGHWFTENPAIQSSGLNVLYAWVNSFHIYAFAMVSGYIFAFKIMRGGYCEYLPFLRNKARRLLVPYVFVSIIWVAPISAYFFNWDLVHVVKKYLFAIDPSQLWFLWMLFGVFVITWPMRKLLIDKPVVGWIISIVFYSIGVVGKRMIPNVFCIWTACQYVLFFFIGMRIRVKEEKQEKLIAVSIPWYLWIIVDIFIFAGTMFVERNSGTMWSMAGIGLNLIIHVIGAIMAWTVLQAIAGKVNWQNSKVFNTLSSYSMPMYLFHQQIIYFSIAWLNGLVNPWINAGVNMVAALICSYIISAFLMRWSGTRMLIGEKK